MKTPIVHLPELRNTPLAKFIQLYVDLNGSLQPILRFASEQDVRHGTLLLRTLDELGIPAREAHASHLKEYLFPHQLSDQYRLSGAGRCEIIGGKIIAFGFSSDYEIAPDEKHFLQLKSLIGNFDFKIDPYRTK